MITTPPESAARVGLSRLVDEFPVAGEPDWDRIWSGLRRARRRHTVYRTAIAAGGVLAVGALAFSATHVLHQRAAFEIPESTLSVVPTPPTQRGALSALARQPTKGSLARDHAWLDAVRARTVELVRGHVIGGEPGDSTDDLLAEEVSVLFTGEVGGSRIAAVEFPVTRSDGLSTRHQACLVGGGGLPARSLALTSYTPTTFDLAGCDVGERVDGGVSGSNGAVVITPSPMDLTLVGPVSYAADGAPSAPRRGVAPSEPGVYAVVRQDGPHGILALRIPGLEPALLWSSRGAAESLVEHLDTVGDRVPRAVLADFAQRVLDQTGIDPQTATPELSWLNSGRVHAAVLTLELPSGARVVALGATGGTLSPDLQVDAVKVVAAGDDPALAWRPADITGAPGHWLALAGPVSAERAQLLDTRGKVLRSVALEQGRALLQDGESSTTQVRFVDGARRILTMTAVVHGRQLTSEDTVIGKLAGIP